MIPKTKEEIEKEKEEIISKGFLPPNDELNETMTSPMKVVEKNPRRFIIEECIPACEELWRKNIYTFMTSDHINNNCWIEVILDYMSDENKEIYYQLESDEILKFSYHDGCVNFGVDYVGAKAQEKLLELAKRFQMQDVPYEAAYITLEDFFSKLWML